jgi:stage II sporulation protein D
VFAQADVVDASLEQAGGGRTVSVRALSGGRVANVPLEVYVARVLAGEGEPGAPEATQQALAIAIRTYAVFNARRHARDGFDLCDTTHCQVLRTATPASRRAALETAGRILTYRGAPAEIFYSASCGGRSESASNVWPNANLPYLQSRDDDVHDDDEPWTLELSLDEVEEVLQRNGFRGRLEDVEVAKRNDSRRASRLTLEGMEPDEMSADPFRLAIGAARLRSTAFSVSKRGDTLQFTGRGYGHGVGMCVIGAGRRARRGESADEILAQYFPGLAITPLAGVPASGTETARRAASAPVPVPVSAPALIPAPRAAVAGVNIRNSPGSGIADQDVERLVLAASEALAPAVGVSAPAVSIEVHATIDGFRAATGAPWWTPAVVRGTTIDLAPPTVLAQRDGVENVVRVAVAEMLVGPLLTERPAWVRVGAARHFARSISGRPTVAPPSSRVRCPRDEELTLPVSAAAQREAESRADACFARAYARTRDWRTIE